MRAALGLLALVCVSAWAQSTPRGISEADIGFLVANSNLTSQEAELFLLLGKSKAVACAMDVRSRECQTLAAMQDNLRAAANKGAATAKR